MKNKFATILPFIFMLFWIIGCSGISDVVDLNQISSKRNSPKSKTTSGMVEGKDYLVLKRFRILDEMGFDKPVEAGSILVPNGWNVEGGIRWKGINECRGEIISQEITITSPDREIEYKVYPVRSFVFSDEQTMKQTLIASSQQGGCQVKDPFDAKEYLEDFAQKELRAKVSNIRVDEDQQKKMDNFNEKSNVSNQQYGLNTNVSSSIIYGNLDWNDGTKGLAHIGTTLMTTKRQDAFSGATFTFGSTSVFYKIVVRYPAQREKEALSVFGLITASSRTNPIWIKAKDDFLTRLGNIEHAGRMERIRLMGKQSEAYAKSASEAADAQMRSWERQQESSDASHRRYIQTIREVETWKDSSGNPVELNAGYEYGWSRPDGSYILTDNSLFDPAVEFKENWERMEKAPE